MNTVELEDALKALVNQEDHTNFAYDLLVIYGIPKATVTRMKKGNSNLAKQDNQLILKNKLFFEVAKDEENLLSLITKLDQDEKTHTYNPRFIIATNFKHLLAIDTKTKDNLDTPFLDL